jgi:glycosyltransferase involved in cell wall biosynthesis
MWSVKGMYSPFLQMFSTELPEADVYHSLSAGYAGLLASLAKIRYNKPFILSEHGIYTRERQEEIIKATWVDKVFKVVWMDFFNYISLLAYKYADVITSLFNDARKLQSDYGADYKKCVVVANGVDTDRFSVKRDNHDDFNVGFITRVVPIKDVLTAIRAFYLVNKKDTNVKFWVMGPTDEDEEYFEQCLELTAALGLSDVVDFMGLVNIKDYMSILDVVMLSSVSEGQPLVLLEAMASGIPCIASDVGSCAEVLGMHLEKKDRCGLIFEPTKYSELANLIMLLKEDESLRLRLGDNGAKRVREHYDYKDMIEKYKRLYTAF